MSTNMVIHNVTQGSPEWLALRAGYFTASEAPAMMGASSYMSRDELLKQKATGLTDEPSAAAQELFAKGHRTEAAFRPHAQELAGEEFFPITATIEIDGLRLLASMDGLDMAGETGFEHKLRNKKLADYIDVNGEPDASRYWQLEHQMLVTGAHRILFATSDGTKEGATWCWYVSKPERREALRAGWKLFAEDLAKWVPSEVVDAPRGETVEQLPALVVEVAGELSVGGNIEEWKAAAETWLSRAPTTFESDQDFANADTFSKQCGEAEARIDVVRSAALAQSKPMEELVLSLNDLQAKFKDKRLALKRIVDAQKESIKVKAVADASGALLSYVGAIDVGLGQRLMPTIAADFAGAIKGKRNLTSMHAALNQTLADAKLRAEAVATKIRTNLASLKVGDKDHSALFPDLKATCTKETEDFAVLLKVRVSDHEAALKRAADKARTEAEEQAAQAAQMAQQAIAQAQAPAAAPVPAPAPSPAAAQASPPAQTQSAPVHSGWARSAAPRRQEIPDPFEQTSSQAEAGDSSDERAAASEAGLQALIDEFLAMTPMPNLMRNTMRTALVDYERFKASRLQRAAA